MQEQVCNIVAKMPLESIYSMWGCVQVCVCVSKAEMEKAADMTDKSVLFVSAGANFWALSAENYDCRLL